MTANSAAPQPEPVPDNVIDFTARRTKQGIAKMPKGSHWYCVMCDGNLFRLFADGSIFCSSCASRITTLRTVASV